MTLDLKSVNLWIVLEEILSLRGERQSNNVSYMYMELLYM